MKTCRKGLHEYEGKRCLECQKARTAESRAANPERVEATRVAWYKANAAREKARAAEWYKANTERKRASDAEWRKANADRLKAYYAARYKENAAQARATTAAWHKANPEKSKANSAAWRKANPEKSRALNAAWRKANPEKSRAEQRAWRAAHPDNVRQFNNRRRARKLGNAGTEPVSAEFLTRLYAAQQGLCWYCEAPLYAGRDLDHRIPLSRGGPHAPANLCWACPSCNRSKNDKTEAEFMAWKEAA